MLNDLKYWWDHSKTVNDIITGLWSSGIFLILLSLLKPRIKICDKIAVVYDKNTQRQEHKYLIKIVNKSIFFKVYDIHVRAWGTKVVPSSNGEDIEHSAVKLTKDYQWVLERLYIWHLFQDLLIGDKRLSKRTNYAAQFISLDKIRPKILANESITVEVIAKHSLTGFTRVVSKTYKHSKDIQKGEFLSGNSCRIV